MSATAPETISTWSFSRLLDFEKCPRMAYYKYALKKKEAESVDKTAANRGIAIHTGAESFVKGTGDLIPELSKVKNQLVAIKEAFTEGRAHIEEDWGFTRDWQPTGFFDKDVWLRVKLDAGVFHDDTTFEVIDWKSGKRFGNEVKHSQQGILYAISACCKYPQLETAMVNFQYTDQPKSPPPKTHARSVVMRMLPTWNERAVRMTTTTEFPPKPNKINCRYCPYSPNNGGDRSCPSGVEI